MIENTVQQPKDPPALSPERPGAATLTGAQMFLEGTDDLQLRRPGFWRRFARHRLALVALMIIVAFALVGIFATVIAPYDAYAQNFDPSAAPNGAHWLGTDELGRDELSRILLGARISLGISAGATLLAL